MPHPVLTRLGDDDWPACDGAIYDREKGECAPVLHSSVVILHLVNLACQMSWAREQARSLFRCCACVPEG